MSLATQVLVGLALGVFTGVFFGEAAGRLQIVGDAFIRLLQMTVMPYILVSLVGALGKLDMKSARELGLRGGSFLLVIWAIVLAIVAVLPLAFPPLQAASFFSSSLVAEREPFDFLALYIPSNPVFALGHNVVPALVLFSIVLGIAIIPVPGKEGLLRALDTLTETLTRIAGYVASLAPVGVFALIASAAGTIEVEELERLQVYLVVYALLAGLLSFVILPGLVTALTPLTWRDIVPRVRAPIITAFAAGNLLIVIPMLAQEARQMAASRVEDGDRAESAVEVIVPASFNFPSAGKLLSLAFLPFAAWLSGSSIAASDSPRFLFTGLFTFFGATSIGVPFLLDLLRLPHDLFQVFLAVDVLTGRFQVMVAAMSTVTLALLGAFAMTGSLRFQSAKLVRFAAVTVLSVGLALAGVRLVYGSLLNLDSASYDAFVAMDLSQGASSVSFSPAEPPVPAASLAGPRLERIDRDGLLRVCYFENSLPYAFVNASNRLVGFDVEMASAMARALSASVEFIRVERSRLRAHLDGGSCDIAMSGMAITPNRTREFGFSIPYTTSTLAFLVADHDRGRFSSWESLAKEAELQVLAPPTPYFVAELESRLPNARVVATEDLRAFLRSETGADALLFTAEAGSAWTLVYPSYAVAVPGPGRIGVELGYPIPRGQEAWKTWVDTWILTEKGLGRIERLFEHWILGRAATRARPRWSILNDVILAPGDADAADSGS